MSATSLPDPATATAWHNFTDWTNVTSITTTEPDAADYWLCPAYGPLNHVLFQMANFFLFLSYLAPDGLGGLLYLRSTLAIGLFFLSTWGYVVLCSLDTFIWNFVCMWINIAHVAHLLWMMRPIHFDKELEQVYTAMFRPLNVSRLQFKTLLGCMRCIRSVSFQEMLIEEQVTRVDSLTLVLSGRFVVSQGGKALHVVARDQFLDSPEWFSVLTDDLFQVSVTAIEESRVLIWHRDKLKLSIMGQPFLQAVFDNVLGRDVVQKLLQVDKTFSLGGCPLSGGVPNVLDRHMALMMAQKTDQESDSAPVTSPTAQDSSDPNGWRLGPIEELTKTGTRV